MKKLVYTLLTLSLLLLTNCRDEFENELSKQSVDHGQADFTTYVALGNSLTAGYQSGALFRSGQLNSYPAILAKQMEKAGRKGPFNQPLMNDDQGGISMGSLEFSSQGLKAFKTKTYINNSSLQRKLVLIDKGGTFSTARSPGIGGTTMANIYKAQYPFNNMGVPGAKSYQLTDKMYGLSIASFLQQPSKKPLRYLLSLLLRAVNPYFVRMASSDTASVLGDALKQKPTFFSLWIGSNDVLFYAMNGAIFKDPQGQIVSAKDQTGNSDASTYQPDDITDPGLFATSFEQLVKALTDQGAKGVVANIPNVTSIPYFTTVGWNDSHMDIVQLQKWTPFITAFNKVLDSLEEAGTIKDAALRKLHYTVGQHNPFLIVDTDLKTDIANDLNSLKPLLIGQGVKMKEPDATQLLASLGRARPAHKGDFILLTAFDNLSKPQEAKPPLGILTPLGNQYVLTQTEAEKVSTATTAYNQTIRAIANEYGLAFVDTNAKLHELSTKGIQFNGNRYNALFIKGGAFSLDGIHPNSRGYAIIANTFIKAINKTYGSKLPQVDPNAYPGITYP